MWINEYIYQIRGRYVNFYLVKNGDSLVLVDGGFWGDNRKLSNALTEIGKTYQDIELILLTHGHLDHTANINHIKNLSGAKVVGCELDQRHIEGDYPYTGVSRICGWLEWCGRQLVIYHSFELDETVKDDDELAVCGGIKVIHLPGHTVGHCGFYHQPTGILFSGDLFENAKYRVGLAPFFLNTCPELFPASIRKVLELNPVGLLPNHCKVATEEEHYVRFKRFVSN